MQLVNYTGMTPTNFSIRGFRTMPMVLIVCKRQFKPSWYNKYLKIRSGNWFSNIWGRKHFCENSFCILMVFEQIIQYRSDNL